jgi:hypothetical protein
MSSDYPDDTSASYLDAYSLKNKHIFSGTMYGEYSLIGLAFDHSGFTDSIRCIAGVNVIIFIVSLAAQFIL